MRAKKNLERKYKAVFANAGHEPIKTWEDFIEAGYYNACLGLFLNGKMIGTGNLNKLSIKNKKAVHTCSTQLWDEFRNQGHGLPLYFALIRAARKIGADRIYSDYRLNRHSKRMWAEKLPEFFKVVTPKKKAKCSKCRHCLRQGRFYIDL